MYSLILIFTLHFFADFPLQNKWVSEQKCDSREYMLIHTFLYAGIITLGLSYLGYSELWFIPLIISHWYIDYKANCKLKLNLWQDQLIHLFILLAVLVLGGL